MVTIKSYTDFSQSKTLSKILPLESADMSYLSDESLFPKVNYNGMVFFNSEEEKPATIIPCWSLAALLGVLTKNKICHYDDRYYCQYMSEGDEFPIYSTAEYDNPVDACVSMIEKSHKLKML